MITNSCIAYAANYRHLSVPGGVAQAWYVLSERRFLQADFDLCFIHHASTRSETYRELSAQPRDLAVPVIGVLYVLSNSHTFLYHELSDTPRNASLVLMRNKWESAPYHHALQTGSLM